MDKEKIINTNMNNKKYKKFDLSRIQSRYSARNILCFICRNILNLDSKECGICQSLSCQECSEKTKEKCSECNNDNKSTPLPLQELVIKELSNLQISCINKQAGCAATINYIDLHQHEDYCPFRDIQCEGCSEVFIYKSYTIHYKECGEIEIKCVQCSYTSKRNVFTHTCESEIISNTFHKLNLKTKMEVLDRMIDDVSNDISIMNDNSKLSSLKNLKIFEERIEKIRNNLFPSIKYIYF